MLLAWLTPLLPCVGLIIFWATVAQPYTPDPNLKQGDRAAHAAADRERKQKLDGIAAVAIAASLAGGVLAIVSLCGIRGGKGVAVIVPGASLGLFGAFIVIAIVGLYLMAAGIKV